MIDLHKIHEAIQEHFKVDYMYLFNRPCTRRNSYIRQLFHYLSKTVNRNMVTYEQIGNYCGDITDPFAHSTVINSIRVIEDNIRVDKYVRNDLLELLELLPKTDYVKNEIKYLNRIK